MLTIVSAISMSRLPLDPTLRTDMMPLLRAPREHSARCPRMNNQIALGLMPVTPFYYAEGSRDSGYRNITARRLAEFGQGGFSFEQAAACIK
jgi:hypothetical protein